MVLPMVGLPCIVGKEPALDFQTKAILPCRRDRKAVTATVPVTPPESAVTVITVKRRAVERHSTYMCVC